MAKIVGVRTEMLARGAPALVPLTDDMKRHGFYDIRQIAEAELAQGALPFEVVRSTVQDQEGVRIKLYSD
jgi:DNA-directed RNA polymerase subunit K/omega